MAQMLNVIKSFFISKTFFATTAIALIIASCVFLRINPKDYNPMVQFLLSVLLTVVSVVWGSKKSVEQARQEAADRWLPQAESVVMRLLTLRSIVYRMRTKKIDGCKRA